MHYVYTIHDPRMPEEEVQRIRYVGEAADLMQRLSDHASTNTNSNRGLYAFFREVFEAIGKLPLIVVEDTYLNQNQAKVAEKWYIDHYQALGCTLFNRDSSHNPDLEIKDQVMALAEDLSGQFHTRADLCREVNRRLGTNLTCKKFRHWLRLL